MTAQFFGRNFFCPQNWGNWPKISFLNFKKKLVINFHWIFYKRIFYLLCSKTYFFFGKAFFLRIDQKDLSESDYRIFKSSVSPEQIDEAASFLVCWYKFTKIKSWLKTFWLGIVKNGYAQSGLWTLKFTVSQKWNHGNNWFFVCWSKFMQIKRWMKMIEVGMVKNGCG